MNGFCYFLPGHRGQVNYETAVAAGLGYVFDGPDEILTRGVVSGPGGQPGAIVGRKDWAAGSEHFGFHPDRQTWTEPGQFGGQFQAGMLTDTPPNPDNLVRSGDIIDGYWLALPDGHKWHCPTARRFSHENESFVCNLPRKLAWSDELERMAPIGIDRRYRALWNLAAAYYDAASAAVTEATDDIDNAVQVEFEFADADKLAIMALQTNYRVWLPEIELLELWDEKTRTQIIGALMDDRSWHDWIKKKLSAESTSAAGGG